MSEAIDLWILDSSGFELADLEVRAKSLLSVPEQQRYERYTLARSRRQLLVSRAMLQNVLSRYVTKDELQLTVGSHGRPELSKRRGLSFNLSHSRDRVVIAVTHAGILGVDVEYAARQRRVERLIARYFSEREQSALLALPESSRLARFYSLWALKEAYIKARGLGLAIPLSDFSFSFAEDAHESDADEDSPASVRISFEGSLVDQKPASWRFWQGALAGEEYAFGLALQAEGDVQTRSQPIELSVRYSNAAQGLEHWRRA